MVVNNLVGTLVTAFYSLVNLLISGIVAILPSFSVADWISDAFTPFGDFLGAINYFIPFGLMIDIAFAWVSAVSVWYVVQFVLRFVQLGS